MSKRETIDTLRDAAHEAAETLLRSGAPLTVELIADIIFAYHCTATAATLCDTEAEEREVASAASRAEWYVRMADHALDGSPDPRAGRPDFVPYRRMPTGEAG